MESSPKLYIGRLKLFHMADASQHINIIYQFTIFLIFFVALLFYIFIYRFSLALRNAMIQEEKAKQDLIINAYRLEKIELERSHLAAQNRVEEEVRLRLEQEVQIKNQELVSFTMLLHNQTKTLERIEKDLVQLQIPSTEKQRQLEEIKKVIRQQTSPLTEWEQFRLQFEKVHPGFFTHISKNFQDLTQNDLRHCAYIRMGMSTKEIARLFNINPSSVQINRVRLKKKLNLSSEVDLIQFISHLK